MEGEKNQSMCIYSFNKYKMSSSPSQALVCAPGDTGMNSTVTARVFINGYSSELSVVPVTCL